MPAEPRTYDLTLGPHRLALILAVQEAGRTRGTTGPRLALDRTLDGRRARFDGDKLSLSPAAWLRFAAELCGVREEVARHA